MDRDKDSKGRASTGSQTWGPPAQNKGLGTDSWISQERLGYVTGTNNPQIYCNKI